MGKGSRKVCASMDFQEYFWEVDTRQSSGDRLTQGNEAWWLIQLVESG